VCVHPTTANLIHVRYSYHYDAENIKQKIKTAIRAWQSPTSLDMAVKRLGHPPWYWKCFYWIFCIML